MEAQETPVRRRGAPGGIWGVLTAIVGVLTLSLCGWYGLIMINPYSSLNPLPPATVTPYPGLVVTAPVDHDVPTAPVGSDSAPTPNPTAPGSAVATLTPGVQAPQATATVAVGPGTPSATAAATVEATTDKPTATPAADGYPGGEQPPPDATPGEGYP